MPKKIVERVDGLVSEFEAGRGFGTFSHGEAIAVALVLDRIDLIKRECHTLEEARDRLGPDWLAAVDAVRRGRQGSEGSERS